MARNRILIIALFVFMIMTVVPAVYAQSGPEDVDFDAIIEALGPREGDSPNGMPYILWDVMLYMIFFLGFINMALIPDKQLTVSLLNFAVMAFAVTAKLLVGEHDSAIFAADDLGTFVINIGMFVTPLLMAGMLRSVKGKKPRAMGTSLIMGFLGAAYFFMFWATEQNDNQPPEMIPTPDIFLDVFM